MNTQLPSVETLFAEALEIASTDDRAAYLERACAGDEGLRRQVETLLEAHDRAGRFLEPPGLASTTDRPRPVDSPGTVIGPYKLMEQIGEGGMGVVYVAEQSQPVRRKVALKVIKPGMDTKQVIARFEAERQALAMMDHPNIAKVHDAGTTPEGRPFFVMELVRGIPITDYCDGEQLSIRDRLELFVLVCRAVQHAHQKGIIHRDLKPSNILVTLHDGVPVPKVIDFGVAKATGQSLTDKTIYTAIAQIVGTPLYMSPEQVELSGLDVDTRSDIYSLGVLLYELLTGTTPFDRATFGKAAFDEMRRIIREEEPPKPSTRLSSLGETLTTVSSQRASEPRQLNRAVRGELDWIVMRSLEKDRRRRYETANDFAADVMRYLTDQPVEACPPTIGYRFSKYSRRHRATLTTAALVGLALIAGTVVSAWLAVRATAAEHRAVAAQDRAEDHLVLARQAVDELYEQVAARWTNNLRWAPLPRPFLEKVLPFYQRFAEPRQVDAAVGRAHRRVGEIQIQLGRSGEAARSLGRAEAIFQALAAVEPESSEHLHDLAACYAAHAWFGNEQIHKKAISLRELLVAREPVVARYRSELAESYHHFGVELWARNRPGAEEQLHRAREMQERLCTESPDDHDLRSRLGMTLRDLGNRCRDTRRLDQAEPYQRRALAIHDDLVAQYPTRPQFMLQLGWSCWELGRTLLAAQRFEEVPNYSGRAATIFEGLGNEYPDVASYRAQQADALSDQARGHLRKGHRAEAEQVIGKIIALGHGDRLRWMGADFVYGSYGIHPNDSDPALGIEFLKRSQEVHPDESAFARTTLGIGYYRTGDIDAAVRELEVARSQCKENDFENASSGFFLAMAYHRKCNPEKARASYDKAVAWMQANAPKDKFLLTTRAEAEALLGLNDSPAKGEKPQGTATGPK
jgi:serine/threonine protein kinase/tetratricopeptide (TPR) repeat protein